jgi:uncharacterized repeat protein (TIGR03803 family)
LSQGPDGYLYGCTTGGGAGQTNGTVFKLNLDGSGYFILHQFTGYDGETPNAVIPANDGALYGTTVRGGDKAAGTIFVLARDGTGYRVLRTLGQTSDDAKSPAAALTEGTDGLLYGTTREGGSGGRGTVFAIHKDGSGFTILHAFTGTRGDGNRPVAALICSQDAALYGTTRLGGTNNMGTVFRLNRDGTNFKVLHQFGGDFILVGEDQLLVSLDGSAPSGELFENGGFLYGTAADGGADNMGLVFRLRHDGTQFRILRAFTAAAGDGKAPLSALVRGGEGAFYGTTWAGGEVNAGTVFRIFPPETPEMLGVTLAGAAVEVRFAGSGGSAYQLLHSSDLRLWTPLTNLLAPANGLCATILPASVTPVTCYRALWTP